MVAPFKTVGEALLAMDLRTMLEFNRRFGFVINETPTHLTVEKARERWTCMKEEIDEFLEAAEEQNMVKMLDALVDADYFLKGTIVMMGLHHAYAAGWMTVHGANMTKVPGIGPRGFTVDLIKPEGWEGPEEHLRAILSLYGYRRSNFAGAENAIDEAKCCGELKMQMRIAEADAND